MILRKKALSRRTLLKSGSAAIALPLLDAMIPAATAREKTVAAPISRIGYVYLPMGADMAQWTPPGESTLDTLSPILAPLESVKHKLAVISGLEVRNAYPGTHATANSGFLSCATAKHTESTDYYLGITADQHAAQTIGQKTQLPSLELAMDQMQTIGQCDNGYACAYQNYLSWSSPTSPLPAEAHPRLVFERLFGQGGTQAERAAHRAQKASLLDHVMDEMAALKRDVGHEDRHRVAGYLDAVREVERRVQWAEINAAEGDLPDVDRPMGVPSAYTDHAKLMIDLQVLALQADITRVITFQLARETSTRAYPDAGVPDAHHPLSHHGNDPNKIARMAKINTYHVSLFAYFVEQLAATDDGEGSLLDHSLTLFGSGMGNPNLHDHSNLPIIVAGGTGSGLQGGRHIRYETATPLANLHMTLLNRVGVPIEQFADSTGPVNGLFGDQPA